MPRMNPSATGKFKLFLLIAASVIVIGILIFSQRITDQLLAKQREVVQLYAKSLEYVASDKSPSGDFSFLFDEVIRAIDFPIILSDPDNNPIYDKNIDLDTTLTQQERVRHLRRIMKEMDERYHPIRIAINDTLVLNYVHYGESTLIRQLRWVPFVEISLAAVFILIAYIGFSYAKRSEQSNIWVGMAKETAHQLGTPLSSLMGWMELVRQEGKDSPRLSETIREMENDVERLNKVTARFSKIGSRPDLKEENLTEVIGDVIRYIQRRLPTAGKRVDIVIETQGEFKARVNRELFEWVLENLMKNALDAMEGQTGKIGFTLSQNGHRTTIDVMDTGKGIEPKYHKDVFRPGYSTKKRGWGLGLSLSRRIIEDYHKGKLYIKQSSPGQGTTFRIRLVQ
jgi:signal transduction histidine kinase